MPWEYDEFHMTLLALRQTSYVKPGEPFPEIGVAREFWKQVKAEVLARLKPRLDDGWQPTKAIGPKRLVIDTEHVGQRQVYERNPLHLIIAQIILALITDGSRPIYHNRLVTRDVFESRLEGCCVEMRREVAESGARKSG